MAAHESTRAISRLLIVATLIALGAFMLSRPARPDALPTSQPRVCFSAKRWGAKPAQRPCARIVRIFEDGSLRVRVEDASGHLRYRAGIGASDR